MRISSYSLSLLSFLLWVDPIQAGNGCADDNCARAVTGTRRQDGFQAIAKSDCSSFMQVTQTVPAVTLTVTASVAISSSSGLTTITTGKSIPTYASACSGSSRYASACSCGGITKTTVTSVVGTTTVVVSASASASANTSTTASSSISTYPTPSGTGYQPSLPTSYADCIFDPAAGNSFQLLDPQAIPIINNGNKAVEATQVIQNLDPYTFSHPAGAPAGIYDIILTSGGKQLYLAVFKSGSVGFVSSSSNGQHYVDSGTGDQYITTIWSITCNGYTSAGILGVTEFYFSINSSGEVIASTTPPASQKTRRDIPVPQGFYVYPNSLPTPTRGERCASGQHAVTKNPPVPLTSNGCGSDSVQVPDFVFVDCCNAHDFCYGECDQTFNGCNSNFYTCMTQTCDRLYADGTFKHWRCGFAAGIYYRGVDNFAVALHFTSGSQTYCDCKCDDPKLTACATSCVDASTDPENCGSCYFHCPSGSCLNGACTFNSCAGQTCATFGPCGPGGSCVCASVTSGTGFCVDGNTPCAGLADCGTSTDCPLGSVCAEGTCCGRSVCITTDQCGGYNVSPKMLFARNWTEGTIGHLPEWVS